MDKHCAMQFVFAMLLYVESSFAMTLYSVLTISVFMTRDVCERRGYARIKASIFCDSFTASKFDVSLALVESVVVPAP
jgi:hypothetical protein